MVKNLKDKNILYITHSYNGWVKFPVEILSKSFNKVYVLVRHYPSDIVSKIIPIPQFKFFSSEAKIDLRNLPANVEVIPLVLWYLPIDSFLRRLGKYHLWAARRALKKKKIHFDIIHSHILWTAGFVGKELAKEYGVPFVATGHGKDVYLNPFKDKVWRKNTTEIMKAADELITVSQANLRVIRDLGIKRRVHVIPNGYNGSRFPKGKKENFRKELKLPKDKKIFLKIGNLVSAKAYPVLLEALRIYKSKLKDCFFVIVGGGGLYSKLKSMAKKYEIEDMIRFEDFQQASQVSKYLLASDFGFLSSIREGMPTVIFEYLAAGLPIVSTSVGGIPEVVNKKVGILVEPNDPKALGEGFLAALQTKWDIKLIRKEAEQYTWEKICRRIEEIYKTVLK